MTRAGRRERATGLGLLVALGCVSWSASAGATYSIVAADTLTRATGGAGTSCLSGSDVYVIYGSVPGVGTLHAQAQLNGKGRSEGLRLLAAGNAPDAILGAITASTFDPSASVRQYAVVDVTGRVAAFTGASATSYAGDRQGDTGAFVYSVQGNILTSQRVVDQAADAFEAGGCDLPERLMRALEAGADHGEGDQRCTSGRGIPADSAFLQVDLPDEPAGSYLELRVPGSGDANPLAALRGLLDGWRSTHPCVTGAAGGSSMGGPDGGIPAVSPRDGSKPPTAADGCGCRLPRGRTSDAPFFWLVAGGLALLWRAKSPHRVRGAHPWLS